MHETMYFQAKRITREVKLRAPHVDITRVNLPTIRKLDAFAWDHGDMTGISKEVITHKLNDDIVYEPRTTIKSQVLADKPKYR